MQFRIRVTAEMLQGNGTTMLWCRRLCQKSCEGIAFLQYDVTCIWRRRSTWEALPQNQQSPITACGQVHCS